MAQVQVPPTSVSNQESPRRQSPRAFSGVLSLLVAFLWSLLGLLATISTIVALVMFFLKKDSYFAYVFIVSLVAAIVFTVIRLIVTSKIKCGLCHGTIVHAKNCRKHKYAQKWPLLSHRQTTLLQALFTGYFTCMFCGTPYRVGKKK